MHKNAYFFLGKNDTTKLPLIIFICFATFLKLSLEAFLPPIDFVSLIYIFSGIYISEVIVCHLKDFF